MIDAFYYIIVVMLNHREQKLVYLLIVLNNLQLSHVCFQFSNMKIIPVSFIYFF